MKKLLLFFALISAVSCSHENQKINFDLNLDNQKSNIGNGTKLDLQVFDDRLDKTIGIKEFSSKEKITITSDDNLAIMLRRKINQSLISKGFDEGLDKIVEIHIKKLEYKAKRKFFIGSSKGEALITVIIKKPENSLTFTKNFSLYLDNKHFIAPLESTDRDIINNLLQEITQDILNSDELLKILAQ
ncbi:MAG: YajG family lipoprotein [Rickettsiales bacterium]|nr:YajG family lipoprotein [Rickettsiales bacterium]